MAKKPKIGGLLDDVADRVIPRQPIKDLQELVAERYPNVELFLSGKDDVGPLIVNKIAVPKESRGQGLGSRVMQDIIEFADNNERRLALTPDASFGTPKSRLNHWYREMDFVPNKGRTKDFSISEAMVRDPKLDREALYRGEYAGNKGGNYYSTDREFARQFTQSGQDKEIAKRFLPKDKIYEAPTLPFAGNEQAMDAAMEEARKQGFKALRVNEGQGQPPSVFVLDKSALTKYGLLPAGLLGAGAAMSSSDAEAAPKVPRPRLHGPDMASLADGLMPSQAPQGRPDWIGDNGAITANPPWLRPDPNERSTLGKLYDAVTTNPVGTFKATGSALGDAVKGYLGEVRQDPGKGVADALELGATAMGGAAPQAFWMATSPDTANAGEDAILAQRRKIMQGLLAD